MIKGNRVNTSFEDWKLRWYFGNSKTHLQKMKQTLTRKCNQILAASMISGISWSTLKRETIPWTIYMSLLLLCNNIHQQSMVSVWDREHSWSQNGSKWTSAISRHVDLILKIVTQDWKTLKLLKYIHDSINIWC